MTSNSEDFHKGLNEIKELYIVVKEVIILAENFDPAHDVYLSPLNELRNSLDHIMRSLIYPDKIANELDEAKEHLYRAGYDAYEVLAINVGDAIIKSVEKYDAVIISSVFPTYYTDVKPSLLEIKVELADERAHKRLNPDTGTKSFTPYKEKISNLIKQLKICTIQVPDLQKAKKKKKQKKFVDVLIGLIIGIVMAIVAVWIYDSYIKKSNSAEKEQNPKSNSLHFTSPPPNNPPATPPASTLYQSPSVVYPADNHI
jgi:hypothetical protein